MSNKQKNVSEAESEVFEIIELAIEDLETLTKAFDVINDVCQELNHPELLLSNTSCNLVVH